jgi:hypothetical protein
MWSKEEKKKGAEVYILIANRAVGYVETSPISEVC